MGRCRWVLPDGYGAGEGVGGGVVGERTNGVQGESSTLQEQYIAGEVGPHGGKMELVGRFSKFWTEMCWKCDGRDPECEPCDGDGTWDVKRYKGKGEEYSKQYSGQASSTVQQARERVERRGAESGRHSSPQDRNR